MNFEKTKSLDLKIHVHLKLFDLKISQKNGNLKPNHKILNLNFYE